MTERPRDDTTVPPDAVRAARPIVLLRACPGLTAESPLVVHLAPVPSDGVGVVTALCGALLGIEDCDAVTPGEGMPCDGCLASHLSGPPPPEPVESVMNPRTAALGYRTWGWPVILRGDQLWLALDRDAVALLIPTPLATGVTELLTRRRCPAPVLAHPYTPDHQVLLAGERYGVALPWPPGVHRITGTVLLPPSVTSRGPLTWINPPGPDTLRLCREIDIATALRALREPPTTGPARF